METTIDKHLLNFLVYKISTFNFTPDCQLKIGSYWNSQTYYLSRINYEDEDDYKIKLENIFKYKSPSDIIDIFDNSDVNMELRISIIQYITLYIVAKNVSTKINEIYDTVTDVESNLRDTINTSESNISDKIDNMESNIQDKTTRLESTVEYNNDQLSKKIFELERKIDILDDKFNLLSNFIDMVANKKID